MMGAGRCAGKRGNADALGLEQRETSPFLTDRGSVPARGCFRETRREVPLTFSQLACAHLLASEVRAQGWRVGQHRFWRLPCMPSAARWHTLPSIASLTASLARPPPSAPMLRPTRSLSTSMTPAAAAAAATMTLCPHCNMEHASREFDRLDVSGGLVGLWKWCTACREKNRLRKQRQKLGTTKPTPTVWIAARRPTRPQQRMAVVTDSEADDDSDDESESDGDAAHSDYDAGTNRWKQCKQCRRDQSPSQFRGRGSTTKTCVACKDSQQVRVHAERNGPAVGKANFAQTARRASSRPTRHNTRQSTNDSEGEVEEV